MMRRAARIVLAAGWVAAVGCHPGQADRPPEPPPDVREARTEWKWRSPGAVVLEVRAVRDGMVALAGGREEGLAPDLLMQIVRGNDQLAAVRIVEVGPEFTVAEVIGGSAGTLRPGDVAVYTPED